MIDAAKAVSLGLRDSSSLLAIFRRETLPVAAAPLGVVPTLVCRHKASSRNLVYASSRHFFPAVILYFSNKFFAFSRRSDRPEG